MKNKNLPPHPSPLAPSTALVSQTPAQRLLVIEDLIDRLVNDIEDQTEKIAMLLREVHASKLYLLSHTSFPAYVKARLGKSKSRAYQLLAWAESTVVDVANERQARILRGLAPDVQARVLELAGGKDNATAALLQEARDRIDVEDARAEEEAARERRENAPPPRRRDDNWTPRDRLNAIGLDLRRARSKVDGSIDHADRLEEAINKAIEVAESCSAA